MKLTYPTLLIAFTIQPWGNVNPKMYPAPSHRHMGIDIGGPIVGAPIYAVCDGTVDEINLARAHGYGRHIILQHDGFKTLYAHQHKILVSPGQAVSSGLQIGEMGGDPNDDDKIDGASTGTHLHFEVILPELPNSDFVKTVLGYTVDPFAYLLQRYGEIPLYQARVVEPSGVRVRTQANTSKTSQILYTLQKDQMIQVVEMSVDLTQPWVRLLSLRTEWVAVIDQGKKLLELTPFHRVDPSSPAQPVTIDEKAIRLDEVSRIIAMLEARKNELS